MSAARFGRAVWRGVLGGVAVLVCVAAFAATAASALGYRPVVVLTGSMGDAVPAGSLAVAAPTDGVELGDVLVMRGAGRPTVTHRVVDVETDATGATVVTTRGDANPDIDPSVYAVGERELTVRWVVPGAGRVLVAARRPLVGSLLVGAVVIGFLWAALHRIWRPAGVRRARRPSRDAVVDGSDVPRPPPSPAPTAARRDRVITATAIASGATIVGVAATLALYSATATAGANQFTTRECYDARLQAVQHGSVSSSTDGISAVPITPVDPARTFVVFSASSASGEPDESTVTVRLASATALEVVRSSDGAPPGTLQVAWSVVEYACGVSVQRGVANGTGTSPIDVSITPVDPGASFVLSSSIAPAGAVDHDGELFGTATLLDADTLRLAAGSSIAVGQQYAWQVVSFDDPADAAVQTVTANLAAGALTTTVSLPSPVAPTSSMLVAGIRTANSGAAIGDRMVLVRLIDDQTVEVRRELGSGAVAVDVQVVELHDGTTVTHGVLDLPAGHASASATIPPVTVARSTAMSTVIVGGGASGGSTAMAADDVIGEANVRVEVTASTTVELQRDASTASASFAWQVVTWGGPGWADLESPFRRRIDVTGGSVAAPDGYTTPLTFDHAAMVAAGQSLASGDDIRIWRHDGASWAELDRVLDDGSSWNAADTTVWFRTREPIGAGATVSYWLYAGDRTPPPVLADPANVWLAVEGFEGGDLGIFDDRTGGTGWYAAAPWTRRYSLTIPPGTTSADLSGQPVLVQMTDVALATVAQPDGSDLRFVAGDGVTRLAHELESFDPLTGSVTAWVRLPTIASGSPTTFEMYAGALDAPAQQRPREVWADAVATWQLAEDPDGSAPALDDSGPGRLDGVALADATRVDTPTGPGVDLDGTLDRLESTPFVPPRDAMSLGAWIRLDDDSREQVIVAQGDPAASGAFELAAAPAVMAPTARMRIRVDDQLVELSGGSLTIGDWHHAVATWDGTTARLYVDGAEVASAPAPGSMVVDGPIPAVIGAAPDGSRAFDGVIGQVGIGDVAWVPAGVSFAAANLLDPATTVVVGPGGTGTWFDQGTWAERRPLGVESDLVAGPLSDHPLLVQVVDAGLAAGLRADAADLVFTADDGVTRLDHQVEAWDPLTGELTAWVRVPTLDDAADALLYLYLGNPTAEDQQDPVGVWGPDADLVLLD